MHLCRALCVLLILVALLQYGEAKRKPGKKKTKQLRGMYLCKSQKACSTGKSCPKNYRYLPATQVCDGVGQCPCNDDEEMCDRCLSTDCPGMFQCKNSTCINKSKVCDTKKDCGENEDEVNCTTPPPDCPGMFQCKNSTCIDKNKVCDTEMDCGENEDEHNCTSPPPGCPGMFQCKNLTCIDIAKVCDTEMNCGENEDEMNCTTPPPNCPGMFQCKNLTCIDKAKVCDNETNCGENEDETNCTSGTCPRMCCYQDAKCYDDFSVNKALFIDIDGFQVSDALEVTATCQAACSANSGCNTIYVEIIDESTPIATCFFSTMTVPELEQGGGTVNEISCAGLVFGSSALIVVFGKNNCVEN